MFSRLPVLALVAAAAGLALAGCQLRPTSDYSRLESARQNALSHSTVRFEVSGSVDGLPDDESAAFNTTGEGWSDANGGAVTASFENTGETLELRVVEGRTYTRFSEETWFSVDSEETTDFANLQVNPLRLLRDLEFTAEEVQSLGRSEVRDADTEQFRVQLSRRDIQRDALGVFFQRMPEMTLTVWVGPDNLPWRLVVEFKGEASDLETGSELEGDVVYWVTLDLFDFGKPFEVEAPPADQVQEFDAGGAGPVDDPFEGVTCYGDRLAECLGVNPELDALAQDPSACNGLDSRVCLVPVGYVRQDIVQAILDFHKRTKNIDMVLLPSIPLAPADVRAASSQVSDKVLLGKMTETYGVKNFIASTFIAITPIDVVPDDNKYGWMFGSRWGLQGFEHQHGVFSYFRMLHVPPYSGEPITDELVYERASKYVARYTAILHLDYPLADDLRYLDYSDMYGFSDLDGIGAEWPPYDPPCLGLATVICVVSDGQFEDPDAEHDIELAVERIRKETGWPVYFRSPQGAFAPSKPDWGAEFAKDLDDYVRYGYFKPNLEMIGFTDDAFAQDASVAPAFEFAAPPLKLGTVSLHGAGTPGSKQHQERVYRLLVRAVLRVHYEVELNDDPNSLLYRGITSAAELDGKVIPPLPK